MRFDQIPPANLVWPTPSCAASHGVYSPADNLCYPINQINPATQITWPLPVCSNPMAVYNPGLNTCVRIDQINPATQVQWPTPCNGVYSPSTNTCVPTGTANNPGGNPGDTQMNSGGNFAKATAQSVSSAMFDAGSGNMLMGPTTPTMGWPLPAGLTNELLIGNLAGQHLGDYAAVTFTTTGNASSGSTTLTVASTGPGQGGQSITQFNAVTGTGIAPGTTVAAISGTTITLSTATTAAIVNGTVNFLPGNTGSLIAIGYTACQNCRSNNGSVVLGVGALQNDAGYGAGGEDQNGVFVGPYAGNGEPGETCSIWGSGGGVFEPVLIGNKVGATGCGWSGTQMIGNHIYSIFGASNSTLIGNEIGVFHNSGVQIVPSNTIIMGRGPLNDSTHTSGYVPAGTYYTQNLICIGAGNCVAPLAAAGTNTSMYNAVLGFASFGGKADGTPLTGTHNNVIGDNIANNLTTGSYNILMGGGVSSGGPTAANLSTGSFNVIVGHGAGNAATTASGSVYLGYQAGQSQQTNTMVAVGQGACSQETGASNVCIGTYAGNQLTGGTNNIVIGAANAAGSGPIQLASSNVHIGVLAGNGEGSNSNVGIGQNAERRNAASAGFNTAVGYGEFFSSSGATGTETQNVFVGDSATCNGCTQVISLGHAANTGAVSHAIQLDTGTNNTSHTMQWQSLNFLDDAANISLRTVGLKTVPTLGSATTLAAFTSSLVKVSGTTAIQNFTAPVVAQNGGVWLGCIKIIPTGAFTTVTGGNIATATTAVVNRVMDVCYDGTTWYTSY